jgi:hypothetical protein
MRTTRGVFPNPMMPPHAAASKRRTVLPRLRWASLLGAFLVSAGLAAAGPPPPPGWRPVPPDAVYVPAPAVIVEPVPAVVYTSPPPPEPPPPLPAALRVVYAPFYVAALTIRYGLYYGIFVPLEVFGRTLAYGFEGGVDEPEGSVEGQR